MKENVVSKLTRLRNKIDDVYDPPMRSWQGNCCEEARDGEGDEAEPQNDHLPKPTAGPTDTVCTLPEEQLKITRSPLR
ncbi:unnamed protein product [Pieris macdunnoughi]|uniref:Uncharacterized protein n=1 Tax=Pieris macdunnoughi TaxID=345717 RepID=A0A821UYC5_9NEOP|nr:unnamed protein product [Pieris macdunnoughi]